MECMTEKPTTAQELEELFGKVDLEQLIRNEVLKEGAEEIQRQYDKHLMTTLYGSSFADMIMNKLHNIRYGFMKFSWTFQQWQALMFSHIPCEGETYEDCDMENLRLCFFQYLNNCEGDYD